MYRSPHATHCVTSTFSIESLILFQRADDFGSQIWKNINTKPHNPAKDLIALFSSYKILVRIF